MENGHGSSLSENGSIHTESLTIAFKLCCASTAVPVLEPMPTGACQHMERYSFPNAPDNQIYAWENSHILSCSCERIQSLLSRVWGLCSRVFLIPCTIGFCQHCSGRPWTSFDVSSMITIYNSPWVGHMGRVGGIFTLPNYTEVL